MTYLIRLFMNSSYLESKGFGWSHSSIQVGAAPPSGLTGSDFIKL
jgi:hypothetical protein